MTYTRFRDIMAAIRYTNKDAPLLFHDKFHEVRQMIDAFNDHYSSEYSPSWLNCIDESMSSWLNKFCPGFMIVPCKPHLQGNEYHSIADADKDGTKPIMWRVKLVEGKDVLILASTVIKENGQYPSAFIFSQQIVMSEGLIHR
jgi:hypothetical protein